ncbi:hypothetical protein GCM10009557_46720 [Virgisporangium ochraceum]|uniref:Uncharacterized protein n=1 Tax=Virgisporangium ochraceum TaxID=65505 RepID=A0A8J3ZTY5_9ACTN|nr:hypothetical protein Voc01_053460 [Virgisporangium ochraceum]
MGTWQLGADNAGARPKEWGEPVQWTAILSTRVDVSQGLKVHINSRWMQWWAMPGYRAEGCVNGYRSRYRPFSPNSDDSKRA